MARNDVRDMSEDVGGDTTSSDEPSGSEEEVRNASWRWETELCAPGASPRPNPTSTGAAHDATSHPRSRESPKAEYHAPCPL